MDNNPQPQPFLLADDVRALIEQMNETPQVRRRVAWRLAYALSTQAKTMGISFNHELFVREALAEPDEATQRLRRIGEIAAATALPSTARSRT